jgi:hypothetical protein
MKNKPNQLKMGRRSQTSQAELELFRTVNKPEKLPKVEVRTEPQVLSLEDYDDAWWDASLKEDCPDMDNFFRAYNNHALGTLCEDLIGAILEKQDQLAVLYAYLKKENYGVPAVERLTPATWN